VSNGDDAPLGDPERLQASRAWLGLTHSMGYRTPRVLARSRQIARSIRLLRKTKPKR
jgi:hypothetical protein